jgi:signal peptide peptidase SppA
MDFSGAVLNRPWAVTADGFHAMIEMARATPSAGPPSATLQRSAIAQGSRPSSFRIAVLPLFGFLAQRTNPLDFIGDTSLERFGAIFGQVLADPSIESIVIEIDSPGGSVYGAEELAAAIFAARGKKRIVAIANSLAASAAYWIGSAAGELSCTPTGEVGSIGILAVHEDWSRAENTAGLNVTLISAGKYKTEGNEHEPLGETARAALQDRVAKYYGMFVRAVAKHRGVGQADVYQGFGEGRVVNAADAFDLGMVDRIETMDELLTRLATSPARATIPRARAENFGIEKERAAHLRLRDALARGGP